MVDPTDGNIGEQINAQIMRCSKIMEAQGKFCLEVGTCLNTEHCRAREKNPDLIASGLVRWFFFYLVELLMLRIMSRNSGKDDSYFLILHFMFVAGRLFNLEWNLHRFE